MPPSVLSLHAPQPRLATVAEVNAERLHSAVTDAWQAGHDMGEHTGYLAGARDGRIAAFCWGAAAGVVAVALLFYSGLVAAPGL